MEQKEKTIIKVKTDVAHAALLKKQSSELGISRSDYILNLLSRRGIVGRD
jgi:hypothetical protein